MTVQKIIKVGSMEIEKGVCVVDFNLVSSVGRQEITHNLAYKILDSEHTGNVKIENDNMISFKHGIISMELYKK